MKTNKQIVSETIENKFPQAEDVNLDHVLKFIYWLLLNGFITFLITIEAWKVLK